MAGPISGMLSGSLLAFQALELSKTEWLSRMATDLPSYLRPSRCLSCEFHRQVVSGKGSVFVLCQSPSTPAAWPKYPAQPVHHCRYFSRLKASPAPDTPDHRELDD
jgi:hypothetical protein